MGTIRDDKKEGMWIRVPTILAVVLVLGYVLLIADFPKAQAITIQTNIVISICGNGIVDPGEFCDSGVGNNLGAYGSTTGQRNCMPGCQTFGPYCGDGILQVRFTEQCDEGGNNSSSGLCSTLCRSLPAAPPPTPPSVVGSVPYVPNATPGNILSETKTQVVLRGKAYPNADVNILLDGKAFGIVRADTNADFLYNTTDVSPGTETFSFWARDAAGVSSITTSVVFEVIQSAVTSVNNIFIPPTLSVSEQKIAPGGLLTLFGQSVPTARVTLNLDADDGSALTSEVDGGGKWALQLSTASIAAGFHSVKAFFSLSQSSKSGFGKSVSFFVGNQLPAGGTTPDITNDGKINLVDFSIFLLSWNSHDVRSDFNQDGIVNLADFSIMLFNWTG